MSFRIKLTHKLLEPVQPAPPPENSLLSLLKKDGEKRFLGDTVYKNTAPPAPSRPSDKGLVIHNVPLAQADHM